MTAFIYVLGVIEIRRQATLHRNRSLAWINFHEEDEVWYQFPYIIFSWRFLVDCLNPFYGLDMEAVRYNKPRPGDIMLHEAVSVIHINTLSADSGSEEEEEEDEFFDC